MTDILCISPVDGREIARRRTMTGSEIESRLAAARRAQAEWAQTSIAERAQAVLGFVEALLAMNDELVPELAWQMGRPIRYGGETRGIAERARHMVAIAEEALAPVMPAPQSGFRRLIKRVPVGLVLVIAPWNYPYLTAINTIVPALMAGNGVLFKPAAQTLLTGDRLQMAADRAGLPAGLFSTLRLDHDDMARLIAGGVVDHINFTGSVAGGRAIEQAAAGTFTGIGLELGGKDPAYVRADAPFERTVEDLVDGAFFNSGQCCCGIERIYVDERLYARFVEAFTARVRMYRLGDPLDEATTLGPMAHRRFADLVRVQTAEALSGGARAHIDVASFANARDDGPYLAPQVLTQVDHGMAVMRDESFGPVVGIMKVRSDDEAIRLMNDSPYGLTASIWTADLAAAERIGDAVETGTVFMNRCDYIDPALAWTGVKDTGRGSSLSGIGYAVLTRPKSYHLRWGE